MCDREGCTCPEEDSEPYPDEDALGSDVDVDDPSLARDPRPSLSDDDVDLMERLRRDRIVIMEQAGGAVIGLMVGFVDFFTFEAYSEDILPAIVGEDAMSTMERIDTFEPARVVAEIGTGVVFSFGVGVPAAATLARRLSTAGRLIRMGSGRAVTYAARWGPSVQQSVRHLTQAIHAYRQINGYLRATATVAPLAYAYIAGDIEAAAEDALTEVIRQELGNEFAWAFEAYNDWRHMSDDYVDPVQSYLQDHGLSVAEDVVRDMVEFLHAYIRAIVDQEWEAYCAQHSDQECASDESDIAPRD